MFTRMRIAWRLSAATAALVLLGWGAPASAEPTEGPQVAVIVHAANAVESIDKTDLVRIFTGRISRWDKGKLDGDKMSVVDLSPTDAARKHFSKKALGKSPKEIKTYWLRQKLMGQGLRKPKVKEGAAAVIEHVSGIPTAIGYIPISALEGAEGIKKVAEF
jgi:ABC-type phosphate transport system substrate-binding protein